MRENYGINSLEFKNIMTSIPSYKEPERIAAISSEFDYRGNVTRIRILFTAYAEVEEKGKIHATEEIYNLYEQGSIGKVKENNQKCVM